MRRFKFTLTLTGFVASIMIFTTLLIGCGSESTTQATEQSELNNLSASQSKEIDKLFANYDDINAPGAAIAVLKDGEIVFKKGYGSANLEYDIPVTSSTVFHVASVSKQFTVFAILLLAEEGKLSFDDDIRTYVPEVPDFGETITLRHLASHTSGLRDQWNLLVMAGWRFDDVITTEHVLKLVANQKELNFSPGEEYLYSNTGFTLMAEVVARVSGQSFAEFTQENMFTPLNMSNTLFYDDHQRIVKNRAYSYSNTDNGFQKSVLSYANAGATSLFTTVEDISLWAQNFAEPKVGTKAIIEQMNTLAKLNNGDTFGGAYGQFISQHKGIEYIQHGGADAGYRTFFARFPEHNLAVSVFNNASNANPRALALDVADIFLKDQINTASNSDTTASNITPDQFIELDESSLRVFEGHYWNEEEFYSREMYINESGVLMYSRGPGNESELAPISKNTFKMLNIDVDLFVTFEQRENEKVMLVTIEEDDPIISVGYVPLDATEQALEEYAGKYYSEELSTYYHLIPSETGLIVSHYRHSDQIITPIKDDAFTSDMWVLNKIVFERDNEQAISGFRVTNGRVRDLLFEKL